MFETDTPLLPTDATDDPTGLARIFPTYMPEVEKLIYTAVTDACSARTVFPATGQGLLLPAEFGIPADVGLYDGRSPGDASPVTGQPIVPIPVVRGWPAYPGQVPMIGVAQTSEAPDGSGKLGQAGFVGDVYALDANTLSVLGTAAYYGEPLYTTVVVELIHENRDERDRLHFQLHRVLYPLRHLLPGASSQIREVQISNEKQELPIEEQPRPIYLSIFSVEVWSEALIPTEMVMGAGALIESIDVTVNPIILSTDTGLPHDYLT